MPKKDKTSETETEKVTTHEFKDVAPPTSTTSKTLKSLLGTKIQIIGFTYTTHQTPKGHTKTTVFVQTDLGEYTSNSKKILRQLESISPILEKQERVNATVSKIGKSLILE